MAKGIPLMGRDPDGKAKMINVDENGNVKVQQSGNKVLLPINDAFRNTFIQPGQTILSDWINVQEYNSFWLMFATSVSGQAGRVRVQYRSIPFAGSLSQPSYTLFEGNSLGNANYPIDVAFNVPGQQIRFEYKNDGTGENRMSQFWLVGIRAQMNWGVVPWTLL
jgi:hypothetical protein